MSQQSTTVAAPIVFRLRSKYDQPATESQLGYLRSLLKQRPTGDVTIFADPEQATRLVTSLDELPADLTKREASGMIDLLKRPGMDRVEAVRWIARGISQRRKGELTDPQSCWATPLGFQATVNLIVTKA